MSTTCMVIILKGYELFPMKSHMIVKEPLGQGEYPHLRFGCEREMY